MKASGCLPVAHLPLGGRAAVAGCAVSAAAAITSSTTDHSAAAISGLLLASLELGGCRMVPAAHAQAKPGVTKPPHTTPRRRESEWSDWMIASVEPSMHTHRQARRLATAPGHGEGLCAGVIARLPLRPGGAHYAITPPHYIFRDGICNRPACCVWDVRRTCEWWFVAEWGGDGPTDCVSAGTLRCHALLFLDGFFASPLWRCFSSWMLPPGGAVGRSPRAS